MKKKNLKEKLINRKIGKPNQFLAFFVMSAFKHISKKRHVTFEYNLDIKKYRKEPIIFLSQHCSRDEYIYALGGLGKYDINVVIGYQNFFEKYVYNLLIKLGTIAKYLYQPDLIAARQMLRVVKNGGSLAIFPEGIQSTSGSTHPINPATMKFLKSCKLPVVLATSHGSYLTRPRYSSTKRIGKMTFSYQLLFSKEDYKNHTYEQLYERLLNAFKYNEYDYNKIARIPFKGKCENIEGLDNIIYKCPNCQSEFQFLINKDTIKCQKCNYEVRMNEYYDLLPVNGNLYFDDIDKWYKWQRKEVAKEVVLDNFNITSKVKVYDINLEKLKKDLDEVGEGTLSFVNHIITYQGSYKGKDVTLTFDIRNIPSLAFSPSTHSVDMYYENDYYCFAPCENKLQVVKWMLVTEEIHNIYDPHWAKASKEVYEE